MLFSKFTNNFVCKWFIYFFQAVAEIILNKHFDSKGLKPVRKSFIVLSSFLKHERQKPNGISIVVLFRLYPQAILCALAEVVSLRFVYGVGPRPGIMGIDFSIAMWLYMYVKKLHKQVPHK